MFRKSALALILCMALLFSVFTPAVYADRIIEIDTGGLWDDDVLDGGDDNSGNTGNDNTGNTDTGNDDNDGNDDSGNGDNGENNDSGNDDNGGNTTYIPGDEIYVPEYKPSEDGGNNTPDIGGSSNVDKPSVVDPTTPATPETPEKTEKPEKPVETETPEVPVVTVSFTDVKENDWFYNDVGTLAGMGIINGYPNGTFLPQNNVTRAEFIKLLVTLIAGDSTFVTYDKIFDDVDTKAWYSEYITTAIVLGIIDVNDYGATFNPDQAITRREVAKLVANSITIQIGGYKTPFADTADHNCIALYRYAIMQGSVDPKTGYRFFYPDTNITRAETAAVILRLYKLVEDGEEYVNKFMKDNNLPPLQALYVPTTQNDFYNVLSNAWDKNQAFVMYNYEYGSGSEQMRVINENLGIAYDQCVMFRPELFTYTSLSRTSASDGKTTELKMDFAPGADGYTYERLTSEKAMARTKAEQLVAGLVSESDTGLQKADKIHDYIMNILEYDYNFSDTSFTACGALTTGKAVCQGYSSLFNEMCRAAGVKSLAVANTGHMWNVVYAGNKLYHYDVTTSDINKNMIYLFKGVEDDVFTKDEGHAGYILPDIDYFSSL